LSGLGIGRTGKFNSPNLPLARALAARVDDEHPISTGVVEERAIGNEDRTRGVAEDQLGLDGLAALN